jgi:PAS domain S-box-containing protein
MRAASTILIVEDTRSLRKLYSHILIQAGYSILEAASGEIALDLLRSKQPDIVLLDPMLPDMDGNEICQTIKSDPVLATTYVIMLSALKTAEDERASGLEAGADDYIVKPVGKRELLARIQVATRLRQAQHDLEVSEAKFRQLVTSSRDGISLVDERGLVVEWNPGQEAITGLHSDEAVGRPIWEILAHMAAGRADFIDDAYSLQYEYLFALQTGKVDQLNANHEIDIYQPDGTVRTVQTVVFPIATDQGFRLGGITRDVTDYRQMQEYLRQREQEFRTLAENAPDIISRIDRNLRYVYFNPMIETVAGVPVQNLIGKATDEVGAPDDVVQLWNQTLDEAFATGREQQIQFELSVKGTQRIYDTRVVPELGADGSVRSVLAVARDFTEHVQAEREIARLAAVIEQTADGVMIADPRGRVVYANVAYERMTGQPVAGVLRRRVSTLHQNCPPAGCCHEIAKAIAGASRWDGIATCRRHDGALRELATTVFPIRNRGGQIINYAVIQRDVTERRQSEREREVILAVASAVRQAKTREEIMDVILDQVMSLMHVVRTVLATVDVMSREVIIERSRGLLAPAAGSRLPVGMGLTPMVLDSGHPYRSNLVNAADLGRVPTDVGDRYAIAGVPLITDGQAIGVLWVSSGRPIGDQAVQLLSAIGDIAAGAILRVELFRELQSYTIYLEQRVQERTRELEQANEQLRELDRLKSKFVSNVTHELRSPISSLRLYMGLLRQGRPERRQQFETIVQDNVERLGKLVEDILSLSRLEIAHYQPTEMAPTDLNAVIGRVVAQHQPRADSAGLALIFEPSPVLPLVLGDYDQLAQLVNNLVVNALTFTQGGSVRISTRPSSDSDMAAVVVEDSGIGIDPEDLPHVFERFYRGNHNRLGDIPGTGLGLAIVKEIVDIHQGGIIVESEVDKGTRVEVTLPAVPLLQPA